MARGGRMPAPVCLIENDDNGKLLVRKEGKDILDGITEPVVVVSVVGLYRTGKSYLMNRLAGQQSGFALGSTIESKTKGIWIWCVPHPCKEGHTLVLLDTEGLGDVQKGDEKHDTWIFCLAVLLSSSLVYNSLGVIDNTALEKLHYVTELTEHIRVKANPSKDEDESVEFMRVFPSFVWAVRDFTLELKIADEPITSDEYLERSLTLKKGTSPQAVRFNLPRQCLRNFFAVRKCFVFPRPAGAEDMRKMEKLTEEDLEPEFLQQANTFCQYIYNCAEPKTLSRGRAVTGTALGNLAEVYVEAIRSGKVPCLENAVVSLAEIQNGRAVEQAMELYMKEMFERTQLPMDPEDLSDIHQMAEKAAVELFITMSFNDNEQTHQQDLMGKVYNNYQEMCYQNQEEFIKQCEAVQRDVFETLENAISAGLYMRPGGYREYKDALKELTNEYRTKTRSKLMSEEVLSTYLKAKEAVGKMILQSDQSLSAAEHAREVERLKNEVLEQRQRSLEEQNRLQAQVFHDMQRTHDEHVNQLMHQMEREQERLRRDNERVLDAKLKEREALLTQDFQRDADRMQRDIDSLKADIIKEDASKPSTLSRVLDGIGTAATFVLPGFIPKAIGAGLSFLSRLF
ncbi:guanylate-binding protein 1-like [Triplophysa rosa]|nr:guanylate-binding protein 1-like [Triplophysa rosa]XP_057189450.1 guanylate-binding protein 1-like [Triplophysa rosa]